MKNEVKEILEKLNVYGIDTLEENEGTVTADLFLPIKHLYEEDEKWIYSEDPEVYLEKMEKTFADAGYSVDIEKNRECEVEGTDYWIEFSAEKVYNIDQIENKIKEIFGQPRYYEIENNQITINHHPSEDDLEECGSEFFAEHGAENTDRHILRDFGLKFFSKEYELFEHLEEAGFETETKAVEGYCDFHFEFKIPVEKFLKIKI